MPRISFFSYVLEDLKKRCEIIDVLEKDNSFYIPTDELIQKTQILNNQHYNYDSFNYYFSC